MTTATHTAMGYRATRTETALIVHDVEIFSACKRGDFNADELWVKAAAKKAMAEAREGYYPPLHIRHHEPETAMNDSVRPAGWFEVVAIRPITLSGKRRNAIFADLHITDFAAQQEVIATQLPYRSVEIFDITEPPSIDGLALLDHEAPYLRLPMLMVSDVSDETANADRVSPDTFRQAWSIDAHDGADSVVACFRRGNEATLLFRQDNHMSATKPKKPDEFGSGVTTTGTRVAFADDDKPKDDDDKGENAEGDAGLDVSAVVKAIESGAISIADMDAILAAIQAQGGAKEPEQDQPAPAAIPGGEAMQARQGTDTERFAAMAADNVKMRADIEAMKRDGGREKDVATAMKRLEGRALGNIEAELTAYHRDHGPAAFKAFENALAKHNGVMPETDAATTTVANAPDVAMKFADKGNDAVEIATGFVNQHEWLTKNTSMRMSVEDYVEINMEKALRA